MKKYATASTFTPLFSCKDLPSIFQGTTLPLDDGLLRPLETIVFAGTSFAVDAIDDGIAKVTTTAYESANPLYTDVRFLSLRDTPALERRALLPSAKVMIETMKDCLGMPYLWGGNSWGISAMLGYYPPSSNIDDLDPLIRRIWQLQGVDCSGLLYLAAQGATPRNTSSLVHHGIGIAIEGIPIEQWQIMPLDIIVWPGHVIIAIDNTTVIESLKGHGVILTPLKERILQIENILGKKACNTMNANNGYVIRRFHPDFL